MALYEITVSVSVEVEDLPALYASALARAIAEGQTESNARELLTNSDPQGRPDVPSCLVMLFDPGVSPNGCEIINTAAKREEFDQDAEMDAYDDAHGEDPSDVETDHVGANTANTRDTNSLDVAYVYTVVENAGFPGERDIRSNFPTWSAANDWMVRQYGEPDDPNRKRLRPDIRMDGDDGTRTFEC